MSALLISFADLSCCIPNNCIATTLIDQRSDVNLECYETETTIVIFRKPKGRIAIFRKRSGKGLSLGLTRVDY